MMRLEFYLADPIKQGDKIHYGVSVKDASSGEVLYSEHFLSETHAEQHCERLKLFIHRLFAAGN